CESLERASLLRSSFRLSGASTHGRHSLGCAAKLTQNFPVRSQSPHGLPAACRVNSIPQEEATMRNEVVKQRATWWTIPAATIAGLAVLATATGALAHDNGERGWKHRGRY